MYSETISKNIKKFREEKSISQTKLAEDLKITRSVMSNYENGNRQPSIDVLIKLADYFNVSLDLMVGRRIRDSDTLIKELSTYYYYPNELFSVFKEAPPKSQQDIIDVLRNSKGATGILFQAINSAFVLLIRHRNSSIQTRLNIADRYRQAGYMIAQQFGVIAKISKDNTLSEDEKKQQKKDAEKAAAEVFSRLEGVIYDWNEAE